MCRLLAYLGPSISLDPLVLGGDHSLVVQSYHPREMEVALLNADGFGLTWYSADPQAAPFLYRNTAPIWNDINLPEICRSATSDCVLAYVRSATPGLAVDLHNCQPFRQGRLTFIHNGFIERFRQTLYRPIREQLCDEAYHCIHGLTDSEHIFAWILHELAQKADTTLEEALQRTLAHFKALAQQYAVRMAANIVLSDGNRLVGCRFDTSGAAPSLYWLRHSSQFPDAVLLASEPLFAADWEVCPPDTLVIVEHDRDLQTYPLFPTDGPVSVRLAS